MSNYGMIGDCRLLNIKVVRDDEVIYLGKVEEAPEEIRKLSYCKVEGGDPVVFYVQIKK